MVSGIMLFDGDFRWAFTRSWGGGGGRGEKERGMGGQRDDESGV